MPTRRWSFLRSVAACAATPIENGLMYAELRDVNQKLSRKIFELHNLFDLSRELTSSFDAEAIRSLFVATVMGHLVVSRAALYLGGAEALRLAHERGVARRLRSSRSTSRRRARRSRRSRQPRAVQDLPAGAVRDRWPSRGWPSSFPLTDGRPPGGLRGGGRAGAPRGPSPTKTTTSCARWADRPWRPSTTCACTGWRSRRSGRTASCRSPGRSSAACSRASCPKVAGFTVAAASQACFQVGGDHYDFIPLEDGRLALTVADVSGKGTPASILMASVHASLRALAGASSPSEP